MGLNTGNNVVEINEGLKDFYEGIHNIGNKASGDTYSILEYEEAHNMNHAKDYETEMNNLIAETEKLKERLKKEYPNLGARLEEHLEKYNISYVRVGSVSNLSLANPRNVTQYEWNASGYIYFLVDIDGTISPVPYNMKYDDPRDGDNLYNGKSIREFADKNTVGIVGQPYETHDSDDTITITPFNIETIDQEREDADVADYISKCERDNTEVDQETIDFIRDSYKK